MQNLCATTYFAVSYREKLAILAKGFPELLRSDTDCLTLVSISGFEEILIIDSSIAFSVMNVESVSSVLISF